MSATAAPGDGEDQDRTNEDDAALFPLWGELLDRAWVLKRSISYALSIPEIDALYERAKQAGAWGGKIIGAGGGGFLLSARLRSAVRRSTRRWRICIACRCGWSRAAAAWFI